MPKSVTSIDNYAFHGCSGLISVVFDNSVTSIGDFAFYGCKGLTSLALGDSITSIGTYAFAGCNGITSLALGNNVTSIASHAFNGCSGITSLVLGNSVTSIGSFAFKDLPIRNIVLPSSLKEIGSGAFYNTRLETIYLTSINPPSLYTTTNSNPSFSTTTTSHGILYVPYGSWDKYVYDSDWAAFIHIREFATQTTHLSNQTAYTLLNTANCEYTVYNPVNDDLTTISANAVNEGNPNHSWQIVEANGLKYLYNLGAKRFVQIDENQSDLTLSDVATPLPMQDGAEGVTFAGIGGLSYGFIINGQIEASKNLNGLVLDVQTTQIDNDSDTNAKPLYYGLSGLSTTTPQKGLNIIRMSDGQVKKVLVK